MIHVNVYDVKSQSDYFGRLGGIFELGLLGDDGEKLC